MVTLYGQVYSPEGFFEGYVEIEEGIVVNVRKGRPSEYDFKGIITPLAHNAHVHLLDSILFDSTEERDLEKIVAPPNGIKFRGISSASESELREGIGRSVQEMRESGIGLATEFREGGEKCYRIWPESGILRVLARPKDEREARRLIKECSGFNFSSVSDHEYSFLETASKICRSFGKIFGIHFSETRREDLQKVLELEPTFLVHACKGTERDFEEISEREIPVVICPRENSFFGIETPIKKMLDKGIRLLLGTDNAMIVSPDLFSELSYAYFLYRLQGGERAFEVVQMAFRDFKEEFEIEEGGKGVLLFQIPYRRPELSLISRVRRSPPLVF